MNNNSKQKKSLSWLLLTLGSSICGAVVLTFLYLHISTTSDNANYNCLFRKESNLTYEQQIAFEKGRAKYIFLFIGDGMGNAQIAAADSYLSYKAGKLGGEHVKFTKFPITGLCTTYSADHQITCSSASGTAFSTGHKTNNGYVGVTPDGNNVESFAVQLKRDGYKVGIMTSVPINHATPSVFYAHDKNRSGYYNISKFIPQSNYDFFAGDGFIDLWGKDKNEENTFDMLARNGYKTCFGAKEFKNAMADRAKTNAMNKTEARNETEATKGLILCHENNRDSSMVGYWIKREKDEMRLSQMLGLGLEYFGDEKPFFIMCEGGEIDWCAHENQTMSMIDAIFRFDEAIQVAYDFYLKHKDETLIVITADHETGGLTLGRGRTWGYPSINWKKLENQWLAAGGKSPEKYEENKSLNESCGLEWTTTSHTGSPVPVFAIGKGAAKFSGMFDNTEIPSKILSN